VTGDWQYMLRDSRFVTREKSIYTEDSENAEGIEKNNDKNVQVRNH